jgi:hypothetical protein
LPLLGEAIFHNFCRKWRGLESRDRCYDFLNIFAEKFSEKIGVFDLKQSKIMQNFDHNIGFWEKRKFFRRKLSKIAENCDHNIDPRSGVRVYLSIL